MSRKGDIILACHVFEKARGEKPTFRKMDIAFYAALEAAYDLGRAEGLTTARNYGALQCVRIAKRLRARVRRAAGEAK